MSAEDAGAAPSAPATAAAEADQSEAGSDGWSQAKSRRPTDKPKFVVFLDKAQRRGQPNHRVLLMATQPQSAAQPLFPGCSSDSESDSEPDNPDEIGDKYPKFVLADVRCLISYLLLTYRCLQPPRWCKVVKPNNVPRILVVVFDSAPPSAAAQLPNFMSNFYQAMRLMSPYAYADKVGPDLFNLPLQSVALGDRQLLLNWLQRRNSKWNSTGSATVASAGTAPAGEARCEATIGTLVNPPDKHPAFPERDKFPRTQLLLSSVQLLHENYPIPGLRSAAATAAGGTSTSGSNYRTSLPAFQPAGPESPMFGLDCEMVVTERPRDSASPQQQQQQQQQNFELARATLVDESGRILLDQLVKPANPVMNYLTAKSGITREMLDGATVTLAEVQDQLAKLLPPDAILVGHSLNCDLHALRICHPSCIDTSVVFNLSGNRRHKASLKLLAQRFLDRDIQSDDHVGHSSAEDALAALNLVQLKLSKSLEFGDAASGDWNPTSATVDTVDDSSDSCAPPLSKRPRRADNPTAASTSADAGFHASLHSREPVSLFDWMRMHGASFRVFDRQPAEPGTQQQQQEASYAEYLTDLSSTYLVTDFADDVAAVEAARAEVKCSRLVVLRLRDLETNADATAANLARLDAPLVQLLESLPQYSMCIALFPGRRPVAAADDGGGGAVGASVARCYFSMRGMTKPQAWGKK